ncbi:serine-rich adhesin for platelets [Centruroides vittatus]|uniref:serine-rich adhesin for platelets n=1 Tax=Centruroides vittatus TaxID=120091 RepID=UPI00350FACEB
MTLTAVPSNLNFISSVIMATPPGARGTNLKGKAQLNSNSKTNKTLFSSASQSFLNFTTKKLTSKGAVSKTSSLENKEFPYTLNKESFVSKTFNSSKNSQTLGANSTGKATGEFCCKRRGVSVSSNNIGASDKKKLQKSEQKLQSKNDDTVIKNFKAKRFFSCSDKGKNKSLVNSKKTSTSKLCISYSKNKNAEDKIDKVKYKKDNENKICEKDNDPNLTLQNLCKSEQDHAVSKEDSFSNNCNFTKSLSDDTSTRRQIKGRQNNPDIKSDSELYGDIHLKSVLKVLRSNLSPEEKLSAIKYSHDYWQKIKNGEIACDDLDKFTENITLKSLTNSVRRNDKFDRLTTDHEIFAKSNIKEKCTKTGMKTLNKMTSLPVCLNMPKSNSEQIALSSKLEEEISVTQLENEHVGNSACNISVNVSESAQLAKGTPPPKSPVTIQDWVNSIDLTTGDERALLCPKPLSLDKHKKTSSMLESPTDNEFHSPAENENVHDGSTEDTLTLGAEAHNLHGVHGYIAGKRSADASPSTLSPQPNKITLDDLRCKQNSFNSETSGISGISSISSVESLLEARREDPEEILLALGFGGKQSYDPLSRIPQRFLKQHSQVRGVDINTFLQQQEDLYHRHDNSSLGYMGLSASPHLEGQPSSAIASRILDRLGSNDKKQRKSSAGSSTSLQDIISVMKAASAFRSGKMRHSSDSILDPANREFLEKQGKEDPLEKPKRLIIGRHTYSFDQEGGLIQSSEITPSDDSGSLLRPKTSKWKMMYQKLEDDKTCVEELDEETLKGQNQNRDDKDDKSVTKHKSLQSESSKRRPLICRQSRIDDDDTFDKNPEENSKSKNVPCFSGTVHKKITLKSNIEAIKGSKKKKDNQYKDSFELDELSPAEGIDIEVPNQENELSAEFEGPCNCSDSSGFAEDAISENISAAEHTKKQFDELYTLESQENLINNNVWKNNIDSQKNNNTNEQFENDDNVKDLYKEKASRLKRAFSFVQGEKNSDSSSSSSDQRRHSAIVPGELIFSQLQRRSSLWHLHPPLWWNNLSDLSYISSSEATLTSHHSMEKVSDDASSPNKETEAATARFISTQSIWISDIKKDDKNSDSNENNMKTDKLYSCEDSQNIKAKAFQYCSSTSESALISSSTIEEEFKNFPIDSLLSKLRILREELQNDIENCEIETTTKNRSNVKLLFQLRKTILTQIDNIENLLKHELKEYFVCEHSVNTINQIIELLFKQNANCQKLEKLFQEREKCSSQSSEAKSIEDNVEVVFKEAGCQTVNQKFQPN